MELSITGSALIIKKQFVENWVRYLLATLVLGLFISGALVFYSSTRKGGLGIIEIGAILQISSLLSGGIFMVSLFEGFSGKQRAAWLSLPVSAADRIVSIVFYSLIIFPIVFCTVFATAVMTAAHFGNTFNEEVSADKLNIFKEGVWYYTRSVLCQSVVAVLATMYRRYAYLKVVITVFVLFSTFTFIYRTSMKRVFALPKWPADIDRIDVADYPENWDKDRTVIVSFTQKSEDDKDRISKRVVKERISGEVWGSLYGFVGISLATNESAIMPVSRYFNTRVTGTISQGQRLGFNIMFYVGLIALWVVVWLRLKEAQL